MSPRRSSRARATQPPPAPPTHTNSSTSSTSSSRAERSTRSKDKTSPQRRSHPRSQSIDDFDDSARPLRRTRSGAEEIKEPKVNTPEDEEDEDGEEEEVTRCICGQMEYPGLPTPTQELLKLKAKEPGAAYAFDAISDDLGGLFIQCDICKVWQHGGCVSILDEASTPEEYFCEQCRRDLHKVSASPSGQKYSNYLPLKEESSAPASPQPASRERSKRATDGKGRHTHEPKRRATLNSREIYNEAEALQRAIEESKREGQLGSDGQRKKRGRSDSDDRKDSTKRPRTGSRSNSPDAEKGILSSSSSDEALASKIAIDHTPKKNVRGAAARNHQAKELREQKERERQEAVAKRKTRAERRHGDESPSLDSSNPPPPSNVSTPPTMDAPPPPRSSHRKTTNTRTPASSIPAPTKPPPRRLGRNQYTKDRDSHLPPSSLSNSLDPNTDIRNGITSSGGLGRTRSRSRSNARDLGSPSAADSVTTNGLNGSERGGCGTHGHTNGVVGGQGGSDIRPSKPKHMNPNRTSMNEMKKRVAAILEFVSRAEDEGGRNKPPSGSVGSSGGSLKSGEEGSGDGGGGGTTEGSKGPEKGLEALAGVKAELDFGAMDSVQMLKTLRARLVSWEDEYGRYGASGR